MLENKSMNILQYESKIWATADLLRGSGIKESEWPSFMMPFFALAMIESRLIRMFDNLKIQIGEEAFNGIDKDQLVKNLKKYRTFVGERDMSDDDLIKSYLELNKYHPVTFGEGNAANPEELKVRAMEDFVSYIKGMAGILNKRAFIKNEISNNFIPMEPSIGFSDDDIRNVEVMSKHFKDKPDNIVKTYSTAGGAKKEVK